MLSRRLVARKSREFKEDGEKRGEESLSSLSKYFLSERLMSK
jgi:hypothetical protein